MDELNGLLEKLKNDQEIEESELLTLCRLVVDILKEEDNILAVNSPMAVCGDVHGNFEDLREIFNVCGWPPETNYLFLGDYVDRGDKSIETLALLLCLKVLYPTNMFLLRGNHETRQQPITFGFYSEILFRFNSFDLWEAFVEVFTVLPIAGLIDQNILCIHGGLSPGFSSIAQLTTIDRFFPTPPNPSLMTDVLWSDPYDGSGFITSPRQAGFNWGVDITRKFLRQNKLSLIVRGHQQKAGGFQLTHDGMVLTVFSSPNYVGSVSKGAVLEIESPSERHITRIRSTKWSEGLLDLIMKSFQ